MHSHFVVGGVRIDVVLKHIKHVHLYVYPPEGHVVLSAPNDASLDTLRLFAINKLPWIRKQRARLQAQEREPPRNYIERESHMFWGRRYLLRLETAGRIEVSLSGRAILLRAPSRASRAVREEALSRWYRAALRARAEPLVDKWAKHLGVRVDRFYIQAMKTKWGSSNPAGRAIRLNLELAKCDPDCLDYVVLHEVAHFIAPDHSKRFVAVMDRYMPGWRVIRERLNAHPLAEISSAHNRHWRKAS